MASEESAILKAIVDLLAVLMGGEAIGDHAFSQLLDGETRDTTTILEHHAKLREEAVTRIARHRSPSPRESTQRVEAEHSEPPN
ncbi:MAG TPA: hypothetical protein VLJ14_08425, partial [Ktedonobacterales bacterium]|nr:hypothetical protein [Ktedonobacterales bacterium]